MAEPFKQYGKVEPAGSYRWDLMMRRDLDFYAINPAVDLDLALEALDGFVRRGDFLRFGFIESVRGKPWQTTPESYPTGYYLGMVWEFGEGEWKVETWFLRSPFRRVFARWQDPGPRSSRRHGQAVGRRHPT